MGCHRIWSRSPHVCHRALLLALVAVPCASKPFAPSAVTSARAVPQPSVKVEGYPSILGALRLACLEVVKPPDATGRGKETSLLLYDLPSGAAVRWTAPPGSRPLGASPDGPLAFSPDGRRLAFVGTQPRFSKNGGETWVLDTTTGSVRNMEGRPDDWQGIEPHWESFHWSPDGKRLKGDWEEGG